MDLSTTTYSIENPNFVEFPMHDMNVSTLGSNYLILYDNSSLQLIGLIMLFIQVLSCEM